MDAVAKSPPDGYTLLFVASSGLTINPYVFNMPIDPLRDLTPGGDGDAYAVRVAGQQ